MRLVDDDDIGRRQRAPLQRLDRGHLDRLLRVGHRVIALHDADAGDALRREGGHGLVDQDRNGTTNSTRLPLASAPSTMAAASTVLPAPVGAWTIGRRCPARREALRASQCRVPGGGGGRTSLSVLRAMDHRQPRPSTPSVSASF